MRCFCAGIVLFLLAGCDSNTRLDIADPEIGPVREWLKENLDQPRWEETVWYKPYKLHGENPPVVVCRIKVRTPSPDGALQVVDKILLVQGDDVKEGNEIYSGWVQKKSVSIED